jgi:chromosome segregation ATPase
MSLLKNLLGSNTKDEQFAEEMRGVLQEMQQERARCESLTEGVRTASDRLQELGEPIAKVGGDVEDMLSRLSELEQRFQAMVTLTNRLQELDERAESLTTSHQRAAEEITKAAGDAEQVRTIFEELKDKVDLATQLKERLESFLEIEKPFSQLRGEAETVRGHVEGTGERMSRLREQHDRLLVAHDTALSKMEALDRRRDDLSRDLQDKEHRVAAVEESVRGMDGVQQTVFDLERKIATMRALGETLSQKAAALDAQREAVERALAQSEHLERAMKQVDTGVRQQQENEKALRKLNDQVNSLASLHETVLERSSEISSLQRDTETQIRATRQDLGTLTDQTKKAVERFEFESRGLESVNQRVVDLRAALTDCEGRVQGVSEATHTAGELTSQTRALAAHIQTLSEEVGRVDLEYERLNAIHRDLDATEKTSREMSEQVSQFLESRPAIEKGLRDLSELSGANALVKDALEQTKLTHDEISRVRETQAETRSWLAGVEQTVAELKDKVGELNQIAPTVEVVQKQAKLASESVAALELRREFVDDLLRRMADLGSLTARLEERDRQLMGRMETAEQQLVGLSAHAADAERLSQAIGTVSSHLTEAGRRADDVGKSVAAVAARCESVEALAEQARALGPELEQRHNAIREATENLEQASELRKEAADAAQQMKEQAKKLTSSLATTGEQVHAMGALTQELEDRATKLQSVEKRLTSFEERLAKWDSIETQLEHSLEQLAVRQGTVETLRADFDRMFATAEKTVTSVREITAAAREVEESRKLLADVQGRIGEIKDSAKALDERKRQMVKAEERLARAEALLLEVRSGVESLEAQKAIVDQAVEKTSSLRFLLKQADARISDLREERDLTSRVRPTATAGRRKGDDSDYAPHDDATAYGAEDLDATAYEGAHDEPDDEEAQAKAA